MGTKEYNPFLDERKTQKESAGDALTSIPVVYLMFNSHVNNI